MCRSSQCIFNNITHTDTHNKQTNKKWNIILSAMRNDNNVICRCRRIFNFVLELLKSGLVFSVYLNPHPTHTHEHHKLLLSIQKQLL